MKLTGSKDIKFYVAAYIERHRCELAGKRVIDLPAGSGHSCRLLHEAGAEVKAYDLFPEFFRYEHVQCRKADLEQDLPITTGQADVVLFQEGIEHLSDQMHALRELNRILRPGGKLLLTTPNYSNLRARLSYLLNESEIYKLMPPNQIESIWFGDTAEESGRFYFGHMFLIGIQRLRLMALLSGLKINKIIHTRVNTTSLLLLPLFYPLILLSSYSAYRRTMRKNKNVPLDARRRIFRQTLLLQIDPRLLTDGHLFVEFEKYCETDEVAAKAGLYHKHETVDFQT